MSDLSLLLPKGMVLVYWTVGTGSWIGVSASYHDTITLGSVVIAAVVAVLGGIFTLRNNLKSFWRDLAEERAEQIKSLEERLKTSTEALVEAQINHTKEMASFAEEQREVRHQLKTELATTKGQLEVEKAKHDFTQVFEGITKIETMFASRAEVFGRMVASMEHQGETLDLVLDVLSKGGENAIGTKA